MSRAAKNTHNAYQRNYTKNHRQAKREANKRYWEKRTHGGWFPAKTEIVPRLRLLPFRECVRDEMNNALDAL